MHKASSTNQLILHIIAAGVCFLAAYLVFHYLALMLFQLALSDFYDVAPEVSEQCRSVVTDAAIAFTHAYDIVADTLAIALLLVGTVLSARAVRMYLSVGRAHRP